MNPTPRNGTSVPKTRPPGGRILQPVFRRCGFGFQHVKYIFVFVAHVASAIEGVCSRTFIGTLIGFGVAGVTLSASDQRFS